MEVSQQNGKSGNCKQEGHNVEYKNKFIIPLDLIPLEDSTEACRNVETTITDIDVVKYGRITTEIYGVAET